MGKYYVWVLLITIMSQSPVAFGLDFDREIRKSERSVKVGYRRPPKTLASFLKHYPECRDLEGKNRLMCNQSVAKERYHVYFQAWQLQERQRLQVSSVDTGDMAVQLEKRQQ